MKIKIDMLKTVIRRTILESAACDRLNDKLRRAIDIIVKDDLEIFHYMYANKLQIVVKDDTTNKEVAIIKAHASDPEWDGECWGGYIVEWANVKDKYRGTGIGALIYDLALELVGETGLMADRQDVSIEALRNWKYFMKSSDYIKKTLDNKKGEFTPDVAEDNCSSGSYFRHGGSMFIGDGKYFRKHPLNQVIIKKDQTRPTYQCLRGLGRIWVKTK